MISCYVPESIKWVVLLYVTYLVPLVRCCLILSQPNASIEDVIRWIKRWVVHVLLSFARVHVLVAWFPPTSFDPIVRKVVEWLEVVFPGVSSMSLPGWLRECYGWLAWCVKAIDLPDVDSSLRMAAPHGITDRFCFALVELVTDPFISLLVRLLGCAGAFANRVKTSVSGRIRAICERVKTYVSGRIRAFFEGVKAYISGCIRTLFERVKTHISWCVRAFVDRVKAFVRRVVRFMLDNCHGWMRRIVDIYNRRRT